LPALTFGLEKKKANEAPSSSPNGCRLHRSSGEDREENERTNRGGVRGRPKRTYQELKKKKTPLIQKTKLSTKPPRANRRPLAQHRPLKKKSPFISFERKNERPCPNRRTQRWCKIHSGWTRRKGFSRKRWARASPRKKGNRKRRGGSAVLLKGSHNPAQDQENKGS